MKRWLRSKLVRLAKRMAHSRFIQSLMREREEAASLPPMDEFVDSSGNRFRRLDGYRDLVVPRWPGMFEPQPDPPVATRSEVVGARNAVAAMERFLQIHGFSVAGADVLEVGCHGGAHAYALAELGAKHVDGIDIPEYGIRESPGQKVNPQALEKQSRWLQQLRKATARLYKDKSANTVSDKVDFFDLDVVDLDKEDAYDAIVSWQTLEHVTEPERAIVKMYRALRPGGVCFHKYGPFFSLDGGHSLCTLDFPWGHVRLSDADFERYIRTYRPQEFDVATNFFRQSLNRMTLTDLHHYCETAGFEILALIAWPRNADLQSIDQAILSQCRALHPTLQISDLISRSVWLLLEKPKEDA